jgi:hypothetical protein
MAGGIDWFRSYHGTVNDPKFRVVAKRAGARVSEALAMWQTLLEQASSNADRGHPGSIDLEAIDMALEMPDGTAKALLEAFTAKEMLDSDTGRIAKWETRQPKRERENDSSAERTRAYRERQKEPCDADGDRVTPSDATEHQKTPRGEESREEEIPPSPQKGEGRFPEFWSSWPSTDRKQDRKKCLAKWRRHSWDSEADAILAHITAMKATRKWLDGFEPAPLTYLNGERWRDGVEAQRADSDLDAIFRRGAA